MIEDGVVSYVDLALDLWVSVDGRQTVLDEDEFAELGLDEDIRDDAQKGLDELKQLLPNKKILRNDRGGFFVQTVFRN
ncbi:MAG: DUF402 domain-containing protein [Ignavibacteriales bacterium]|nr:DUF402 domain-containing protein [Ignavibacteriales bacterium]